MIEPQHPRLSVARQCELVSISRSGFYYQPAGETPLNLALMRLIDVQFDRVPTRGVGAMLLGGLDRRVRLRWLAD
jgi:putative transposase